MLGALIGYALGISPRVEAVLSPCLLALQIAPKVAFAPLFVMWLGYTMYPKILVAVLIVFFPVLINVLSAMRAMDADLVTRLDCDGIGEFHMGMEVLGALLDRDRAGGVEGVGGQKGKRHQRVSGLALGGSMFA